MKLCIYCGKEIDVVMGSCDRCRQVFLASAVPPEFRTFDISRLPSAARAPHFKAMGWVMGARGLVLAGESGHGKTRTMWEVLKKFIDARSEVFCPGPHSFSNTLTKAYKTDDAEFFLESVSQCSLMAIDDITKLKMTERVESELFGVIDYRCCHHLPIIATAQCSPDELMSRDKGGPLMRRLREFCDIVEFRGSNGSHDKGSEENLVQPQTP